jgi:glycosyltransferase involved in cell wall biosynthesis
MLTGQKRPCIMRQVCHSPTATATTPAICDRIVPMKDDRPAILLLSAYDTASHQHWQKQLIQALPQYQWSVLTLPPRHFRWRIRGNPVSWLNAPEFRQDWDLLMVTSMVDLACIKGLNPKLATIPAILYMHENQFAYPQSASQYNSLEPAMVNLYAGLSADKILFNSQFNKNTFIRGVADFLNKMPDQIPEGLMQNLDNKSAILPVAINNSCFCPSRQVNLRRPHILWNHRWEYDKGPQGLLLFLRELKASGREFTLSVVGKQFRRQPKEFSQIQTEFKGQLVNVGYLQNEQDYRQLLLQADIVLSTALHDFQGLAMLEAMAAGCMPLAPERLAYPEYVPDQCLYTSTPQDPVAEAKAAVNTFGQLCQSPPSGYAPVNYQASYLAQQYARHLSQVLQTR